MTRALLVIDVQESFRQQLSWPAISNPGIAGDVARLVDGVRANGDLVVWVLHSEPGSETAFDPASGHVRYLDPLKPQAGEPQLTKTSHNAFTTTNLQQLLTQQGITEVIVCGIRTEQCCETTARVAFDLGYQVAFVTEATATGPATAAQVAREMVVYARRNGDEQQASAMLRHRNHLSDTAHRAQDHIEARFAGPLPLAEIARKCGVSERTLTRRFTKATGLTPLRYQQLLRLERAEHLIGHGATIEAAARTVGFEDARMLRRLRAREPALPPKAKPGCLSGTIPNTHADSSRPISADLAW